MWHAHLGGLVRWTAMHQRCFVVDSVAPVVLTWRPIQRADLGAVFRVEEAEHHRGLTMVEPEMAPGIAMMDFVVAVLSNLAGQMVLGQGCLFDWWRRRVTMSPPCLMFVGCRLLPVSDSLGS